MSKVIFIERVREDGAYSVKSIIASTINNLKNKLNVSSFRLKRINSGIINRLVNYYDCISIRDKNCIYHLSGDSSYLSLVLRKKTFVITFLDCVSLEYSSGLKRILIKFFYYYLPIKRAKKFVFISEFTKKSIQKEFPNLKIDGEVIYPPLIITNNANISVHPCIDALKPFALHVGSTPNKNLKNHIRALEGTGLNLVVIGKVAIRERELAHSIQVNLNIFNAVSQESLQMFYSSASLMLFASTYEGFGMPIIEAQYFNTPVITSNRCSMPEAGGEGCMLVDPDDINEIRQSIKTILSNHSFANELRLKGKINIKRFSPIKLSEQYFKVFK